MKKYLWMSSAAVVIGAFKVKSLMYYQKADNKIFVFKFSKNVKSKLYHNENSKTTRG